MTLLSMRIMKLHFKHDIFQQLWPKVALHKELNAQWEIWACALTRKFDRYFCSSLKVQNGAMWTSLHFSHWVKSNYAYQRSAPWGFAEIWWIWGFVGSFEGFWMHYNWNTMTIPFIKFDLFWPLWLKMSNFTDMLLLVKFNWIFFLCI